MPIARKFRSVIPRPMRPSLTRLVLEKIAEGGEILLDSFFPAKYPEAKMWRKIIGLDPSYEFKRPTFIAILAQLKTQGLVRGALKNGRRYWKLTTAGNAAAAKRHSAAAPKPDGQKRLICFDIPEQDRAKRQWLRSELIACGWRQLQKSVWIGETPLPQEFIETLDTLNLRGRIHILRVESAGTLN